MKDNINKFKDIAKEQINKVPTEVIKGKFNEQYNKLPLDDINEKLGGKVDVKSSKFKKVLVAVVAFLVLCTFIYMFKGSSTFNKDPKHNIKILLALPEDEFFELSIAFFVGSEVISNFSPQEMIASGDTPKDLIRKIYKKIGNQNKDIAREIRYDLKNTLEKL